MIHVLISGEVMKVWDDDVYIRIEVQYIFLQKPMKANICNVLITQQSISPQVFTYCSALIQKHILYYKSYY